MAALDDLKAELGISGTSEDALLERYLDAAREAIITYVGTSFWGGTASDRYFAAPQGELLLLPWVVSVSHVYRRADTDTPEEVATYYLVPDRGPPYYGIRLPRGERWTYDHDPWRAVKVTAVWAYSLVPPADVYQAWIIYAAYLYRRKDVQALEVVAMPGVGASVIRVPPGVPKEVRALLDSYCCRL